MTIHLNCPGGHIPLETPENVKEFIKETNSMHDAYLLSADYRAHIRANHHTVVASTEGESLVLRYQVTSLPDLPIVELTFLGVSEWKVPNGDVFGILDSLISFDTPFVTFFDGNTPENATTLVKARKMYWRIVDRPNLQRGGTEGAVWYVIPGLWLPMNENLEDYTQIVEELAATVPNAKLYHTGKPKPIPCADAVFTTDYINSFRSEEATCAEEGKAFCWYELSDSESLKETVSILDDGLIIAIIDDNGVAFTVEMFEWGFFNMVICSRRGYIPTDGFCGGKYYVEPYSGGGMEELS